MLWVEDLQQLFTHTWPAQTTLSVRLGVFSCCAKLVKMYPSK